MFGIKFMKTKPTDYVLLFKNGKIKKQGTGLSFFYYAPTSSLVILPADSRDTPFIFKEATVDFQEINIQGQLTYKVSDPWKLSSMLDFSVDQNGKYIGDGPEKIPQRITNIVQIAVREHITSLKLMDALTSSAEILIHQVFEKLKKTEALTSLGIEVIDFSLLKVSPTPEMSRALEINTREQLYKEADEAVYMRRNYAVEQERIIKENELQTQISVEEKNRKIREEQMNAEIAVQEKQKLVEEAKMNTAQSIENYKNKIEEEKMIAKITLEEKKKNLVQLESENHLIQAKARSESMKLEMSAFNSLSPEALDLLLTSQLDSSKVISRAFKELSKNAQKIGTLNITPELLENLIKNKK